MLLGLGVLVGGAYAWHEATQLPDWYRQSETKVSNETMQSITPLQQQTVEAQAYRTQLQQQLTAAAASSADGVTNPNTVSTPAPANVKLSASEMNHLVVSELTTNASTKPYLPAIKGVDTEITSGQLKSGAVVNLSDLPLDQLPASQKKMVDQLVQTFPQVADRDIYVALRGQPKLVNGQIQLQEGAQVQIGNLNIGLKTLAQRLGVSEAALEQQLTLHLGDLQVQNIQLQDDQAVLEGVPR